MNKNNKTVLIIITIIAIIAVTLGSKIISKTIERNNSIKELQAEINALKSGESTRINIYINDEILNDKKFKDYLIDEIKKLYKEKEYFLLTSMIDELTDDKGEPTYLVETVEEMTGNEKSIEDANIIIEEFNTFLEAKNELKYPSKNSSLVKNYLNENPKKEISKQSGTGYYKDKTDYYKKDIIGLEDSPLYDELEIKYHGDFKVVKEKGVKLNQYYREEHYSRTSYYFRDVEIDLNENYTNKNLETIWAGDYIFLFDKNETIKIKKVKN